MKTVDSGSGTTWRKTFAALTLATALAVPGIASADWQFNLTFVKVGVEPNQGYFVKAAVPITTVCFTKDHFLVDPGLLPADYNRVVSTLLAGHLAGKSMDLFVSRCHSNGWMLITGATIH